jgi:chondroitin 4-sulfotransferase 11
MINPQYRCIFIHIPKTGGKSVQRFFGTNWQDHKDISRYAEELTPQTFTSYYKFAIVRNPWDRLVSDYNYQKMKKGSQASHGLLIHDERGNKRSFSKWLEAVLSDPFCCEPTEWGARVSQGIHRWSPQVDWICISGKIAVDRVLRMENLQEGFAELRCALGLPSREMPCRNWRWHRHYSYYYNESTRRLVEKYYAKDIETFGYRFGFPSGILQWAVPERLGIRLGDILSRLGQARMKSGVLSLPLPNSRIGGARIQDLTR